MKRIGTYADIAVSLDWRDDQQFIVFTMPRDLLGSPSWHAVHGLVKALGCLPVLQARVHSPAASKDHVRVEMPHTEEVDERIVALIDLLITARYEHPTMVQLPLELDASSELHCAIAALEAALS